jgi:hypothetical protein
MSKKHKQDARVFSVDTRFQRMARRVGGIPREQAIEQAQVQIEEIKVGFDEWLEQEIQALANLIRRAQAGDAEPDWIEIANFRSRQLRDVGTTMDSELLTFIADALCQVLDAMAAGTERDFDSIISHIIMCHIDALLLIRHKSYRRLKPDQLPELTNGLRKVVNCVCPSPNSNAK